ncbi:MAG TPA: GerMN domain-containing protein [Thermoanaerobaculia bacterium]|nr:GerMN domain-containing protein [Thermoanaerobaculia bacterium]
MRRVAVLALALVAALGACKKKETAAANLAAQNKVAVRQVRLFYESPQMLLVGETRNIALPESSAAALPIVVRELMKGPTAKDQMFRLFPEDTIVRATYLLPGGTAIVDLGGPTLAGGWGTGTHQELMAAYSLAQTVSVNFTEGRRVRVLINGAPAETLGGHVALTRSLEPLPNLVDPRFR